MDIALATCTTLPEPDPDEAPLLRALADAGLLAGSIAWDDPSADPGNARLTLLRSTWNYPHRSDAFIAWAEHVARVSILRNPIGVVRWNVHKRYLLDLESKGIPVVPTVLVRCGEKTPLRAILEERGWSDVVIKPAISCASLWTIRASREDAGSGESHLRRLAASRDVLVQPYLPSVEDHGERAIVWVDGVLTHAVRKTPRFTGEHESVAAVPIGAAEAELSRRAVAAVGEEILYARIDVARNTSGAPVVMELELIEPSLFFDQGPDALERMVAALRRTLRAAPPA